MKKAILFAAVVALTLFGLCVEGAEAGEKKRAEFVREVNDLYSQLHALSMQIKDVERSLDEVRETLRENEELQANMAGALMVTKNEEAKKALESVAKSNEGVIKAMKAGIKAAEMGVKKVKDLREDLRKQILEMWCWLPPKLTREVSLKE